MRGLLRRVALLYVLLLAAAILQGVTAAAANAATATTTPVNWLDHVPVPYVAGILIGAGLIPILSAIATSHPSPANGLWAAGLSLLDAVLTAVAHAGNDNWKHVAAAAVSTWLGAAAVHSKIVKKRDANNNAIGFEGALHSIGYTGRHRLRIRTDSGQLGVVVAIAIVFLILAVLLGVGVHPLFWLLLIVVVVLLLIAR
jgi:hypothetical protein